jgi:putative membrane protein insertion efficiency factor
MKSLLLLLIRMYQRVLSPDTGLLKNIFLTGNVCRYTPRCSEYTYQAIEAYGIIKGLILGFRRILRCHPWSKGGFDPIPQSYS